MSITLIIVLSVLFVVIVVSALIKLQLEDHAKKQAQLEHQQLEHHARSFSKVCEELLKLKPISPDSPLHYKGALTQLTTLELQLLPSADLAFKLSAPSEAKAGMLTLTLRSQGLTLKRGINAPLSLPLPSTSSAPFELFFTGRVLTPSLNAVREAQLTSLSGVITSEDKTHLIHLKPWLDKVGALFEQTIKRCETHELSWTQEALRHSAAHPIWTPMLLYLAASEQDDDRSPQWRSLLERDAEHWSSLPTMPRIKPSFDDEPGELLQRLYPLPTEEMVRVLARRGELARMLKAKTLSGELALFWLKQSASQGAAEPSLYSYLGAQRLAQYLSMSFPLHKQDSLMRLQARLQQDDDPLRADLEMTLEAIGLLVNQHQDERLFNLLSSQLEQVPTCAPTLSVKTNIRLLNTSPQLLYGSRLLKLLKQLNDKQFVQLKLQLMTSAEPWLVFDYALEHPNWREYIGSNLNPKHGWELLNALLRDKRALNEERLRKLYSFVEAPLQSEEQARILREYFLVAQELELHKELWTTLLKTMKRSKLHQETLQFIHDRWEPLTTNRGLIGGLSLSEDHSNAGALSVVHAEHGSLTIQDEQEPS